MTGISPGIPELCELSTPNKTPKKCNLFLVALNILVFLDIYMHLVTTAEEKVMSEDGLQNCPVVIFHTVSIIMQACSHRFITVAMYYHD